MGICRRLTSVATSASMKTRVSAGRPLSDVLRSCDNSLKRALTPDPKSAELYPNKQPREVFGQFVEVNPTPLEQPFLVSLSPAMASELDLDSSEADSEAFARFFSGAVGAIADVEVRPWATPYAVSVFGQPIPSPDPFGRGNGYGDGRALSLGEVVSSKGRWELQLKGCGTTPFSRGGDGRAVLRSSIREYLVSECMHAMGVPTTRALCLVASKSEYTRRMWYANDDRDRDHPPDTLVSERCAITCRAAPSFLRVGHIELWSRRAARGEEGAAAELRSLVRHAIGREFSEIDQGLPERDQLLTVVREFARRQAELAVHWLRVGYVQGNMNSDNCLLSGRTMDYGPFGFVERYEPLWSPFTSDMERKFGFERQPLAAQVNVMTLARALMPLFERLDDYDEAVDELQDIVEVEFAAFSAATRAHTQRRKLGLLVFDDAAADTLSAPLNELMASSSVDFTILWRQLSAVTAEDASAVSEAAEAGVAAESAESAEAARVAGKEASEAMFSLLAAAFYEDPTGSLRAKWFDWLRTYGLRLHAEGQAESERQAEQRSASPK